MENIYVKQPSNGHHQEEEVPPRKGSLSGADKPILHLEDGKIVRKTAKGKVESADIKRSLDLAGDP